MHLDQYEGSFFVQSLFSPIICHCRLKKGKDGFGFVVVHRFLNISRASIAPTMAIAAMMAIVLYVEYVAELSGGIVISAGASGAGSTTKEVSADEGQ